MEEKLRALVEKIELSNKLPTQVKDKLYETIQIGLQSLVWPILLDYIPKEKLQPYIDNPKQLTVEAYIALLNEALAINDGEALVKMEQAMTALLNDIDAALIKEV